jgi:hypothetical protein
MASRIGKTEWKIVYLVTGFLDFVQFVIIELILVWFFGLGAAINEILDPIVGFALAIYLSIRGVNLFQRMNRLVSMVGMEAASEFTGGAVQLWILDVWYIHRDVKKEEAEAQAQKEMAEEMSNVTQQPLNQGGVRAPDEPDESSPEETLNTNGRRRPRQQSPYRYGGEGTPSSNGEVPQGGTNSHITRAPMNDIVPRAGMAG